MPAGQPVLSAAWLKHQGHSGPWVGLRANGVEGCGLGTRGSLLLWITIIQSGALQQVLLFLCREGDAPGAQPCSS
jgi:hypothetical protein